MINQANRVARLPSSYPDNLQKLVAQSHPTLETPWTVPLQAPKSVGFTPGKNTGMGCHFLLQGIFLKQGSNSGLLHCRQILYYLSHQRRPMITCKARFKFRILRLLGVSSRMRCVAEVAPGLCPLPAPFSSRRQRCICTHTSMWTPAVSYGKLNSCTASLGVVALWLPVGFGPRETPTGSGRGWEDRAMGYSFLRLGIAPAGTALTEIR